MNSSIVEALVNRYSAFGNRVNAAGTPEDKARMIFQAMLTREPTTRELEIVRSEIEFQGEASYEGVIWALLNTQQFIFVQ